MQAHGCLDIDVEDESAVQTIMELFRATFRGVILERTGRAPKCAVPLYAPEPFKKVIRKFSAPDGKVHKIEVLGDGQQFVVSGIHPDTGTPYSWRDRDLTSTSLMELPVVSEGDIHAFLDLCAEELKARLGWLDVVGVAPDSPMSAGTDPDDVVQFAPIAERIEKMQYGGEFPINDTLLAYSGEQLREGVSCDDVIKDCLTRAHKAYEEIPGDPQERPIWDWNRIRSQIEAMVYGYIAKYHGELPRIVETLPNQMLKKWRAIEAAGGTPHFQKRRFWGVEDEGPAEPLPEMEASRSPKKENPKQLNESKYPRLEFIKAPDLSAIPPREFYLGKQYQRGAVSGTMAPGGRGKSSLDLVEAVSMATGRALLSEEPPRRLKVWYHNGEENWDELCRRLDAVCRYYGVEHSDLEGWLCMTNPQKFPLRVAEIGSGDRFTPDRNLLAHMYEEIRSNKFEVISLDPLITLHGVPENNPVMMRGVMDIFRDLAAGINCSCEIVGHTRKPPIGFDAQLTAYDTRGSGAIVDALRSVRMLDLMTVDEAQKVGVEEYQRERHVKITPAKRNYSATSARAQWIRTENLIIANGDDVGVVAPWEWPGHDPAAFEAAVQRAEAVFLEVMAQLKKRGKRLSDKRGVNFAPKLIAETPEAKEMRVNETVLVEAIGRLIESGRLEVFDGYKDGKPVHELRVPE
jgi:AAA domain